MKKNKYYVTTAIYYVNAKPHLGSTYETILADTTARFQKLAAKDVYFLTGTDEHGQKVQEKAQELGLQPQAFVDSMIEPYKNTFNTYNIEYDKFIRTTDPEHIQAVTQWIEKLIEQDDIYKSQYSGWYCVPEEKFISDTEALAHNKMCPDCKRPLKEVSEEGYFFRLSAYESRLLDFYEKNPNFIIPKERFNEVISFVKSGLKDLSISRLRKNVSWGIPFPGDPEHTIYVWGDALNNYISAIGYGNPDKKAQEQFNYLWPADLHVMGKDIVRFHAVYWPAFLMSAELELPKHLLVHGYILVDNQKMSKSLGNSIDPNQLADWYGTDQIRYYLLRHMPINQDGNFNLPGLEDCITSDLANNLGNLLNRTVSLALKNNLSTVKTPTQWEGHSALLRDKCEEAVRMYWEEMDKCSYHIALSELWKFISEVNAFFHAQQPWKLAQTDKEEFDDVIAASCNSLYAIAIMLWPVMPTKTQELLASIGQKFELGKNYEDELRKNKWDKTFVLTQQAPLFVRPETHVPAPDASTTIPGAHAPTNSNTKTLTNSGSPTCASTQAPTNSGTPDSSINIEDFAKVNLHVGTVQTCEPVSGSDKLYKLTVNFGPLGIRQILSGIAKNFMPEDLIGKQGVFVTNLKPRKLMGLESNGMMLFVKDDTDMAMVTVGKAIENGTRLS
ncbi:MAG: methionine--tRNA ligase [bacterium]